MTNYNFILALLGKHSKNLTYQHQGTMTRTFTAALSPLKSGNNINSHEEEG